VIRRAFWLGAGAAAGIMGYRRVEAIGRQVSGRVAGTVTGAGTGKAGIGKAGTGKAGIGRAAARKPVLRRSARGVLGLARESARFSRDVREGMDLYMARHNASAATTLSTRSTSSARTTGTRMTSTRTTSTRTRSTGTDDKDGR
jgi:hypothetical protein